jgi:hypothetical protein
VLGAYGAGGVWVEREDGDRRMVPVSWTSLIPRVPCRLGDGREVRLSPEAVALLARWVECRRGRS